METSQTKIYHQKNTYNLAKKTIKIYLFIYLIHFLYLSFKLKRLNITYIFYMNYIIDS